MVTSRLYGVTEVYWSSMHEDKKLIWRLLIRSFAIVAAFFVVSIDQWQLNLVFGCLSALFSLLLIESQRSCRKYSPLFRKHIIRICIFLGSWSIAVLGGAYFAISSVAAFAQTVPTELNKMATHGYSSLVTVISLVFLVVAFFIAFLRAFRGMEAEEFIFHLPRRGLIQLLVKRSIKVRDISSFALFEISVLLICALYGSTLSSVVNLILKIL